MDAAALTKRAGAVVLALAATVAATGCPASPLPPPIARKAAPDPHDASPSRCAGLAASECGRAAGLLAAASAFGNVRHEYLLDPASAMAPGRGVQRAEGAYAVLPTRCAKERSGHEDAPKVDASTIDFSYVGVSIDHALVSADVDLAPWLSAGAEGAEHELSLVAVAFVRDLDPQFFAAADDVTFEGAACACGRATHFIGAVKMGGLLSFETRVRAGEVHGRALDLFRARLAAGDARIKQTVIGGLEVEGLDLAAAGAKSPQAELATRPLSFRVKNPVPVAYAIYPLSDVCKLAFPAPEVSPELVDFGDVPYGQEATRLVHVVNRAPIELRAAVGDRTFAVPALGSVDLPLSWSPTGSGLGCETQTREETFQFYPRDNAAPVMPKSQSVRVVSRVRTGKPTFRRHEHVDSGTARKPDYAATRREWTCPDDYAVASCRTEGAQCSDGRCGSDGYAVNAEPAPNGCRFGCTGPVGLLPGISANFCRFDAVMECRLRCR